MNYKASRAVLGTLEPVWLSWLLLAWTVPSLVKLLTGAPAFAPALHSPTLCWWSWAVLAPARQGLRECKQAVTHLSHSISVNPGYKAMSFTKLPWSLKFAAWICNEAAEPAVQSLVHEEHPWRGQKVGLCFLGLSKFHQIDFAPQYKPL